MNLGRDDVVPVKRSVDEMRAASWRVLDGAYGAGVRWIDVARSYGLAEEFLAGWLSERGHQDVTISSKWGYTYVGDWRVDADVHEAKEHSLVQFRKQVVETQRLLGDRLSLYQVHSLTADSPLFTDVRLLAALVESGLRLGFSTSGPAQADMVRRALELRVDGERVFTAVQSTWNPLEPSVGNALADAHDAGTHVLVKESLANGRLAVRPPVAIGRIAVRHKVGPDAVALAAAIAQPWADTVLLGPSSVDQLHSNLAAAPLRLTAADLVELAELAQPPEDYWAQRAALPWS